MADESTSLLPTVKDHFETATSSQTEGQQRKSAKSKFPLRLGYGCGHAQNDLCAAMYFSYLLVYLEGAGLTPVEAGIVLIAGQLVDGMATPIIGFLSDQLTLFNEGCCFGLSGKRKAWYIIGVVMVSSTFWALFTPYPETMPIPPVVYYSLANCILQVGWASVQISHMSLVPELTPEKSERTVLNSIRFAVTVGSSITIYILVWLLPSGDTGGPEEADAHRKEEDLLVKLQYISYLELLIGFILAIIFIILVKETVQKPVQDPYAPSFGSRSTRRASVRRASQIVRASVRRISYLDPGTLDIDFFAGEEEEEVISNEAPKSLVDWFKTPGFFGVLSNYFLTRLCVNTLQLYLPFFVLYTIPMPSAVATVPLTAYIGMCISSTLAPRVSSFIKDAAYVYISATTCLFLGTAIVFLSPTGSYFGVSLAALVLGLSCAQLMVTTQTQVCELVGHNPNGGIVFGMNSFADKVSTGFVIYGIQQLARTVDTASLGGMYEKAATIVPLICAVLGSLSLLTVPLISEIGFQVLAMLRKYQKNKRSEVSLCKLNQRICTSL